MCSHFKDLSSLWSISLTWHRGHGAICVSCSFSLPIYSISLKYDLLIARALGYHVKTYTVYHSLLQARLLLTANVQILVYLHEKYISITCLSHRKVKMTDNFLARSSFLSTNLKWPGPQLHSGPVPEGFMPCSFDYTQYESLESIQRMKRTGPLWWEQASWWEQVKESHGVFTDSPQLSEQHATQHSAKPIQKL